MMNAGGMKDNVFLMSSTKANMINVMECSSSGMRRLQTQAWQNRCACVCACVCVCVRACEYCEYSQKPNKCQCKKRIKDFHFPEAVL